MALLFDEIGYWSEIKLDIIEKYASAYSRILSSHKRPKFQHVYIDAFAGSGKHISKTTGSTIRESPQIALDVKPPFNEYFFIDIDGAKVAELERLVADRPDAHVFLGDCNSVLLTEVFPKVRYEDFRRGLCLLDPYGLSLSWEVIQTAGQMKSIDMFLNFPVMDMNRNVLWINPSGTDAKDIARMNAFWGDDSWKGAAYQQTPNLIGEIVEVKRKGNEPPIALAFSKRLRDVGEFAQVSKPLPMRNSQSNILYYLIFASQKQVAKSIMTDIITNIFKKYANRGLK